MWVQLALLKPDIVVPCDYIANAMFDLLERWRNEQTSEYLYNFSLPFFARQKRVVKTENTFYNTDNFYPF